MTLAEHAGWLDAYGSAWEGLDATAFSALFADDAVYWWGPFSEPLRGRREIEARVAAALARQTDVRFGYELLALTDDGRAVSRWWVSHGVQGVDEIEENEGVFVVTLDGRGHCIEFHEWWNSRRVPTGR